MRHTARNGLIAVLLLFAARSAAAAIPQTERDALIAIYNATGGSSWADSNGWLGAPGTECTWDRVQCDDGGTTVVTLHLQENRLTGSLPSQIGALTNLRELYLWSNALTGPFPSEVGQLAKLEQILASENQFSGALPAALGNLKNLAYVDFRENQLTSIPPEIGSASSLVSLQLEGNQISGAIPAAIGNLTRLDTLDLSNNRFTGSIPDTFASLTNLTSFSATTNQLSGSLPAWLGSLAALQHLDLSVNQFSGPVPPQIGSLTNLLSLDLNSNQLTGSIPPELGRLTNLQTVSFYSNKLTGAIPPEIANLKNATYVSLQANQLSGAIPPQLGTMSGVEELSLATNALTGPIPTELAQLPNLQELNLSTNQLEGAIPPAIMRMPSLRNLDLSSNKLTGTIPTDISLPKLQGIWLTNNQLSGTIPKQLASSPSLQIIHLGENALTGTIPPELMSLSQLQELGLYGNQLTGTIPSSISQLTKLTLINLSGNQLSGAIPAGVSASPDLDSLYLGANAFTGTIPPEIGNAKKLEYLTLEENQLTGPIPSSIGSASALIDLRLGANALTGDVPPGIWQLTNLTVLLLDDNSLSGVVPPDVGTLRNLLYLGLSGNRFSGALPPALGNLTALVSLGVGSNAFSGAVPSQVTALTNLANGESDFSYNALTADPTVKAFIEKKQGSAFDPTQTVAPAAIAVTDLTDRSAVVSWIPIAYTEDEGGLQVTATPRGGGSPVVTTSSSKDQVSVLVRRLQPSTTYDFVVRTVTHPHGYQQNLLVSDPTSAVSGTTTAKVNAPADVEVTASPSGLVQIGGVPQNTDSFVMTNFGDLPTTIALTVDGTFFQVSPTTFTLNGGASQTVTITSVPQQPVGAYDGGVTAAGDGVPPDLFVYVGLLSVQKVEGRALGVATTSRVEIAGDVGSNSIGQASFTNRGTATLFGILIADVPWITVSPELVTIDPGNSFTTNFTVVRSKRPDAGAVSGTVSGTLNLVYVDGSAAGANLSAVRPDATATPPGLSVTTVVVVDTAKPSLSAGGIPGTLSGEVARFIAGISTMSRPAEDFVADVAVTNTFGVRPIDDLRMYLTSIGGTGATVAAFGSVDPARAISVANVARTVYGVAAQVGTLQIRSRDWDRMIVNAHLRNRSGKTPTIGTSLPVFRSDRATPAGQSIYLPGVGRSGTEHSDVYVQETSGNAATVQIDFLDSRGVAVGPARPADALAPYGLLELANGVPTGAVTAVVTNRAGSAGSVVAYAIVVDEQSGDTWTVVDWSRYYAFARNESAKVPFVETVAGSTGGGRRRAVPHAAAAIATDLTLFNPDATPTTLKLQYRDAANATSGQTITLAGRETRTIADAVRTLGGSGASPYGYITVDPLRGTYAASSRTYQNTSGGTLGTAAPLLSTASGLRVGQKQTFAGIDDSASGNAAPPTGAQQTGLGFVETTGSAVTVRATMLLADGKSPFSVVVSRDFKISPLQFVYYDSVITTLAAPFANLSFQDLHDLQIELEIIDGSGAVTPFLLVTDPTTADTMLRLE